VSEESESSTRARPAQRDVWSRAQVRDDVMKAALLGVRSNQRAMDIIDARADVARASSL
jgi:hypothetical protein